MRRPSVYPENRYKDPNDLRLVQVIKPSKEPESRSVNILGVPFDGAVLGRKGAAGGPGAIRQCMSAFSTYNHELGESLENVRVTDVGDILLESEDVAMAHSLIESEVSAALKDDSLLVVLGGDNSLSLPALTSCSKKVGKIGLVVVDSHLDLRETIGGIPTSGTSYGLAIERGIVRPTNVVEIGIHGFLNSKTYVDRAKRLGIGVIAAEEVRRRGPERIAQEAYTVASRGVDAVYLSVDLDAIDLSQVSGVSAPSAGGLTAGDVFAIAHEIAKRQRVVCADLVELAPSLDPSGSSARVAATVLVYLIAGYHSRTTNHRKEFA